MSRTLRFDVLGCGLWGPGLVGWDASLPLLRGEVEYAFAPVAKPAPELLSPTERRRSPESVLCALESGLQASRAAALDAGNLISVFSSTHGDLPITDYMCATLATAPETLSPTRFHNSVHNAAVGYWTIGNHCMRPSTAISAHQGAFGAGLLEALSQSACEREPVLLVAYDIAASGPLAQVTRSEFVFACALVLEVGEHGGLGLEIKAGHARSEARSPALEALASGNPMAHALATLEALALGESRQWQVPLSTRSHLQLELHA
jgi:hypothetical protein